MDAFTTTLDNLGRKHGTDKSSSGHDYLRFYAMFLEPLRPFPIRLLEMGVGSGASLRMWRDYFSHGLIVGMDVDNTRREYASDRISIVIGDQSVATDLDRALARHLVYDVINDDAGHQPEHQLFALKYLFPYLAPRGLYILEDIGSSQVTEFLNRLALRVVHANPQDDNDQFVRDFGPRIESVSFYRETCVMKTKE